MSGVRADVRLVELGLAPSREKARTLIMAGEVFIDTLRIDKPGAAVPEDALLTVKEQAIPFVSRGGLKLDKAVRKYGLDFTDMVTMDVGASTGGFTDCMLQNGAKKVYAIDVGYGQLDWKLRNDPRVVVMERTNARNMEPVWFTEAPDFASMDVSLISVMLILPGIYKSHREGAQAGILVKPQFEAGKEKVGKKGVVSDPKVHLDVLENLMDHAKDSGFTVLDITFSPIRGPEGYIEYLGYLESGDWVEKTFDLQGLVEQAHAALDHGKEGAGC